jgi:hypothetical protein
VRLALTLLLLAACGGSDDTDTDELIDTGRPVVTGCDETFVWIQGPQPPRVDDVWTLLMKCKEPDGRESTITGPMIIRGTPASAVRVTAPDVTFVEAGPVSIIVQVGSYRNTIEADVSAR